MPNITVTNISSELIPLNDFYTSLAPSASVTAYRATSDISRMKSMLNFWQDGTISVSFEFTPQEVLQINLQPSRQDFGKWAKENLAASLTNSPLLPPEIGASSFAEILKSTAGVITGIWAMTSIAPEGSALTIKASVNNVASSGILTMADGGPTKAIVIFDTPVPYNALDTIGIMVSTGAGWTSVSLDVLAGLIIIDNMVEA